MLVDGRKEGRKGAAEIFLLAAGRKGGRNKKRGEKSCFVMFRASELDALYLQE